MNGHLHLTAVHDPIGGRSHVGRQSFRAPMHVGKGDWRDGVLTVFTVNSTAGLFAGDTVEWRVDVEPGARLRLVNPSATRVHRAAREGVPPEELEPARSEQRFRVGAGGFLEVWPELFIPHAGCRYRQTTRIDVETGGELLFCESLAPGRVASGEAFAWESLQWATDIFYGGKHAARERWEMRPDAEPDPLTGWRNALGVPAPFYATVFFVSTRVDDTAACWQHIHDLQAEDSRATDEPRWIGVSRLRTAGWTIRLLARDGAVLRRTLAQVRALLLDRR